MSREIDPTVPTRPAGDSTNAAASTAFVTAGFQPTLTLPLPIADGGTGTATPAFTAGANIIITGSFPFYTIAGSGGAGTGVVGSGLTNQFAKYPSNGTSVIGATFADLLHGPNVNNVVAYGADPTGAVDATTAINAAITAALAGATGGLVYVPPGTYLINTAGGLVANVAAGKSFNIRGSGPDCTVINSSAGISALNITLANGSATFHIRDFTVATGAVNTGNGITITATTGGTNDTQSDISNVNVRGNDGNNLTTNYFAIGIAIVNGASSINFTNISMPGNTANGGTGISLQGDATHSSYGILYNFTGCSLDFMNIALVYGSFIQGVEIVNTVMTGNNRGIFIPSGSTGSLFELVISSSQFNSKLTDIFANVSLGDVNITSSNFSPYGNVSNYIAIVGVFTQLSVTCCTFINTSSGTSNFAIVVQTGSRNAVISANLFVGIWLTGVTFQGTAANGLVINNIYDGVSGKTVPVSSAGSINIGVSGP